MMLTAWWWLWRRSRGRKHVLRCETASDSCGGVWRRESDGVRCVSSVDTTSSMQGEVGVRPRARGSVCVCVLCLQGRCGDDRG